MNGRIDRLRERLEEPLLVTSLVNVRYLTGFASSNAALLVEPRRARVFADFRYAEQGRRLRSAEFVEVPRNLLAGLREHLPSRVAFESAHVTHAGWETLRESGAELVPTRGLVEGLRAVKEDGELDAMRRAAAITERVYERLAEQRFSGRTERELAFRIATFFHEEGSEGLAFDTIVAAGANAANPHTVPGDREIREGETVIVDCGGRTGGYASDCTRTFAVGGLPDRLGQAYEVVRRAQQAGLDAVRAGVRGADADAAAREVVDATEFEGRFGHGLGHGVGLEVHEAPTLRPESEDVLEARGVVTVEPGIYLPDEGGIRIEDIVVVTEDGCDVLSGFTKDLVVVG